MTTEAEHHSSHFSESAREVLGALYDFTVCERSDGSRYGTPGACRKGKEVAPAEPQTKRGLVSKAKGLVKRAVRKVTGAEAREKAQAEKAIQEEKKAKAKTEAARRRINTDDMVQRIGKDLPSGAEAGNVSGTLHIKSKTRAGHTIDFSVSRTGNVEFSVNGTWDAGSVKDRREQVEIALTIRRMHEAVVKNLRSDHILWTQPWDEDGKGGARKKAYEAMGFSEPKGPDGVMIARRGPSGRLEPYNDIPTRAYNGLMMNDQDFSENEAEDTVLWYKAIFGEDLKRG